MEINLIVMAATLLSKLIDSSLDISTSERLCISEQNMVICLEFWTQSEFESNTEAFTTSLITALVGDALPTLIVDRDPSLL